MLTQVLADVGAELDGVGAVDDGVIVDQLPLPDFAALRIDVVAAAQIVEYSRR